MRLRVGGVCALLFLLSNLWVPATLAQDSVSVLKIPKSPKPSEFRKVEYSGDLSFEGAQYTSSIPGKPELDHSLLVKAELRPQMRTENTFSAFDFSAQRFMDWGSSNYTVRELYWSRQWQDGKAQLSAGRKLEYWSELDHDWMLGMWQPKSVLDSLRPEEQGLTGVFWKQEQNKFQFLGVLSPIFIPTMGPEIKEEDGNLVSENRWYRSPSPNFVLFNQQRKVVYSLNVPDLKDLVGKPGIGTRFSYNRDRDGVWTSVNLGYKPMNSMIVKYDKRLTLSEEGQDTGLAPLYPSVTYHSLWGADVGYRAAENQITFSYLEDHPDNKPPEDTYIIQYANPMKAYSVHAQTEAKVPGILRPLQLAASYLRIDGGDFRDFDHEGSDQGAVFAQRFYFYNAAMIEAKATTQIFAKKLITKLSYMREFEQRGMLLSTSFEYFPVASLALTLGADVLGVDDTNVDNKETGFLNEFRANDRVYAGVSYVF